ncbi:UNKNOWN [Stylonychia lemnae]|uniref:Uncharacterized protein n=1 Tax=Stylonychia lemnae TaxID=5949 RepID=A0A077ZWE5_STYLE|nr:UNKNOWN [Stylonychia lemnae]|eukprot:CDW72766.1 UNKNOWN [Stylonychia lemnae]
MENSPALMPENLRDRLGLSIHSKFKQRINEDSIEESEINNKLETSSVDSCTSSIENEVNVNAFSQMNQMLVPASKLETRSFHNMFSQQQQQINKKHTFDAKQSLVPNLIDQNITRALQLSRQLRRISTPLSEASYDSQIQQQTQQPNFISQRHSRHNVDNAYLPLLWLGQKKESASLNTKPLLNFKKRLNFFNIRSPSYNNTNQNNSGRKMISPKNTSNIMQKLKTIVGKNNQRNHEYQELQEFIQLEKQSMDQSSDTFEKHNFKLKSKRSPPQVNNNFIFETKEKSQKKKKSRIYLDQRRSSINIQKSNMFKGIIMLQNSKLIQRIERQDTIYLCQAYNEIKAAKIKLNNKSFKKDKKSIIDQIQSELGSSTFLTNKPKEKLDKIDKIIKILSGIKDNIYNSKKTNHF